MQSANELQNPEEKAKKIIDDSIVERQLTNATRNSNSLSQQQPSPSQFVPSPLAADGNGNGIDEQWYDVATVPSLASKYVVKDYCAFSSYPSQAQQTVEQQIELEPGTMYKFRICAVNSVGQSSWSPVSSFRTCLPGFPGAPSSIKIQKFTDGALITWDPPTSTNGVITEYAVYLAMRSQHQSQVHSAASFVPVYVGAASNCLIGNENLALAHIDTMPKPAILFRIAAKNEKGYGPATQVRWLQDRAPLVIMPPISVPGGGSAAGISTDQQHQIALMGEIGGSRKRFSQQREQQQYYEGVGGGQTTTRSRIFTTATMPLPSVLTSTSTTPLEQQQQSLSSAPISATIVHTLTTPKSTEASTEKGVETEQITNTRTAAAAAANPNISVREFLGGAGGNTAKKPRME